MFNKWAKLRKYLMKHRMRKKVKKAFEPYHKGEKSFHECQGNALTSLLGPAIEPFDSIKQEINEE